MLTRRLLPLLLLAAAAPTAAAGEPMRGPNGYLMSDGDLHVVASFTFPAAWKEATTADSVTFTSKHGSVLTATLAATAPASQKGRVTVTHDVQTHVLACSVTAGKRDKAAAAAMKKLCAHLDWFVIPDEGVTWTVTAAPASVKVGAQFELSIHATNNGSGPVKIHRDPMDVKVDGAESQEMSMAFGNGGRGAKWSKLAVGDTADDARDLTLDTPGDHVISIGMYGIELARTTVHVTK